MQATTLKEANEIIRKLRQHLVKIQLEASAGCAEKEAHLNFGEISELAEKALQLSE